MAKHPGGRPPKYNNCMDFDAMCELYFESCDESGDPYTMAGLALACDLTGEGFREYKNKPEFSAVHARARSRVEDQWTKFLFSSQSSGGAQFALKHHYGWKDRQQVDHTSSDGSMSPKRELTQDELDKELKARGLDAPKFDEQKA